MVKILEQSDTIYNLASLKELLHRKGLNMRFAWLVLSKLRLHTQRDLLMISILLRTMRRIINEEIKLKAKTVQNSEGGIEEQYMGATQIEEYKEVITLYMNALIKKKINKHKEVFEETLTGLFLARMSVLGIVYSINLKTEEFFYLQSIDILVDIFESPYRNPALFLSSVQSYFHMDFKPELLRQVRSDKLQFLSKSQPLSKSDLKSVSFHVASFFSLREQAYFNLARQITNASKDGQKKIPGKIKTKSDKDKLKSSFQKPPRPSDKLISSRSDLKNGIGPVSITNNSVVDH